jgi:hypothetical protein
MPPPWRDPSDPANARLIAEMMAFYREVVGPGRRRPGVTRYRTIEEMSADRDDPYRR